MINGTKTACSDTTTFGLQKMLIKPQKDQIKEESILLTTQSTHSESKPSLTPSLLSHNIVMYKHPLIAHWNPFAESLDKLQPNDPLNVVTQYNYTIIISFFQSEFISIIFVSSHLLTSNAQFYVLLPFMPFQLPHAFFLIFFFFAPTAEPFFSPFLSQLVQHINISYKFLHIYNKIRTYIYKSYGRILHSFQPKTCIQGIA